MTQFTRLIIITLCILPLGGLFTPSAAQIAIQATTQERVPGQAPTALITPEQLLLADTRAAAHFKRPFGPKAPWNVRVAGLPVHPESDYYALMLWKKAPSRPGNFNLGFKEYTYPVYYLSDATGLFTVRTAWPSNLNGRTIPWNPAWRPALGKDAQVIVLDPATGREWNLFQVHFSKNTVIATNANLVPGNYHTNTLGFLPSRGVGIPYLAMLVRPEEIAAGRIDHALSMPIRNPSGKFFVPPALKLERETGKHGIPEGMRFALNVTEDEIQAWASSFKEVSSQTHRSAVIIARALRDYGWFITDTAGGATFQFEADVTARGKWAKLGLAKRQLSGGRNLPIDLLDGLITPDRIFAVVPSNQYPAALRP